VSRTGKVLAVAAGVAAVALLMGFAAFVRAVAQYVPTAGEHADAIVVLTGGEHRLIEAARLLNQGRGSRLLISGVNRVTGREDLRRKSGISRRLFDCCVEIGYEAHDTVGNAQETRAWADAHHYTRLIIVTSSYHMPRSLAELGRALPGVELVPYPVVPSHFTGRGWWLKPGAMRLLVTEYLKFLPSATRFGLARLVHWDDAAIAGSRAGRPETAGQAS
jgi:uncharacterized SAM-binding protein YcdF (DUF218 family)